MLDKESLIKIKALSGSLRDRLRFVRFLFDLYQNSHLWVPPMIRDELNALDASANPRLEECELQ